MKKNMNLTAEQIQRLDKTTLDKQSNDQTYRIAMDYHRNCNNRLLEEDKAFWADVCKTLKLDPTKNDYMIKRHANRVEVVKVKAPKGEK